jgi:hypothetical protein
VKKLTKIAQMALVLNFVNMTITGKAMNIRLEFKTTQFSIELAIIAFNL